MNYIFLDNGFEEIEAITTIDLLRRADIALQTVSVTGELLVSGAHAVTVKADSLFEETDFSDVEMLILPGGATRLGERKPLCELLLKHNAADKPIAAICAAPSVLGTLGILEGKQATCYPGFESYLGESYVGGLVVESKNIITAKGPGLTTDFAFCLIEKLAGTDVADKVYDVAQY
ncbi:MAG: DJ-1/PfpI family protein [Paludibacter sp.]|nr:DJ-1/PfpI family protein [Bacteroidales bacterium]MCM1069867.1 DJ-1/PfpI family protein [Prevotella sp.]MCM1353060.1 DJ-1/PfpI family protein [Bacteroides sp.]MCM1443417.1 DJ-1/PfpI family protein [Muribaculum sp.]MCM1481225.1 DJ-1/PfpI family protein [Paludibacter sp.]